MKKHVLAAISFVIIFSVIFCNVFVTHASDLTGDINSDGKVNSLDALIVLQYSVGLSTDVKNFRAGDVNSDMLLNSIDALIILQISVGLINPEDYPQDMSYLAKEIYTANDLGFIREIAKAVADSGKGTAKAGFEAFAESLKDVKVGEEAQAVADMYLNAKKAMIVFNQNLITEDAAALLADIALASGHIGSPRDGILQVKAKNNSQGLVDLGITAGAEALEGVKALVVFGEEADIDTDALEVLAVCDTHMTPLAAKADVVIPGTGFASTDGTYTNTERRLQLVQAAIDENIELSNWEVATEISHIFEIEHDWEDTEDISMEMNDKVPAYKYAEIDEVLGGVLVPTAEAKLVAVADGKFADPIKCTDSLMNVIAERLPKPANPTA